MLEKLKANQSKIIGHFVAALGAGVLAGIVGSVLGESLGYGTLVAYVYGVFGQEFVAELIEKKMNK